MPLKEPLDPFHYGDGKTAEAEGTKLDAMPGKMVSEEKMSLQKIHREPARPTHS